MTGLASAGPDYRFDIQLLRAFAVSVVVLYHADLLTFSGGYLGVDIFFVVSGYLMTKVITKSLRNGNFSFRQFFLRRARRLLPASLVTVGLVSLLAPFILGARELHDLYLQVIGAVSFTSNIVLWRQSGYFSAAAELKPLLHIWSLSLEEQYYFVLPVILFCLPQRLWKPVCLVLICASALTCFFAMKTNPTAAFYLLPARAWELGIGSFCALASVSGRTQELIRVSFWPTVAVLVLVSIWPPSDAHPGWGAAVACVATGVVLLRRHPSLGVGPGWAIPVWLGNVSYSLYLVHWPILAFLNNTFVGGEDELLPLPLRLSAIILALTLAGLMYRFVEIPGKQMLLGSSRRFIEVAAVSSVVVIGVAIFSPLLIGRDFKWSEINRTNYGLSSACGRLVRGGISDECVTSSEPQVLVWGDSFAMHLVPGLVEILPNVGFAQATRSNCGPFLGVAKLLPSNGNTASWARDCIEFNDQVLTLIEESSSVDLVVVSSPFSYLVGEPADAQLAVSSNGEQSARDTSVEFAVQKMDQTIARIRRAGKSVLLVPPPPRDGRDIGRCIERFESGLPVVGGEDCNIDEERYHSRHGRVREFISQMAMRSDIRVLSFEEVLCSGGVCSTSLGGTGLYRDGGHLSHRGSELLLRKAGAQSAVSAALGDHVGD